MELLTVLAIIGILAALLLPSLGRAKGAAHLARCKSNLRQMSIAMIGYVQDYAFYPGGSPIGTNDIGTAALPLFWFQKLQPYTHSTWTQPLYDCPGFLFDRSKLPYPPFVQDGMNQGEYSYNQWGTRFTREIGEPLLGLGLDPEGVPAHGLYVSESRVLVPSDMVALGDAYDEVFKPMDGGLTEMWGYQAPIGGDPGLMARARSSTRARHTGVFNVSFCDGHVEHMKPSKLFGQDDASLMRLNTDHQSHRGQWPPGMWPTISD